MINITAMGIPCMLEILSVSGRYRAAKTNTDPDSCYEAEEPEIEWQLCDRRGRPAPWIKLSEKEHARLDSFASEYVYKCRGEKDE